MEVNIEETTNNENSEFTDVSQFLRIYMAEGDSSLRLNEPMDEERRGGSISPTTLLKGLIGETTVTPVYPTYPTSSILSPASLLSRPSNIPPTLSSCIEKLHPRKGEQCIYCNKLISKRQMRAHLRIHTGEKPYECEFCQKRFARSDKLKTHRRMHTGEKPYSCFCGRRFTRIDHMKMHATSHSNIDPTKRDSLLEEVRQKEKQDTPPPTKKPKGTNNGLPCPYCPSRFIGKYKLERHIRTHTGDKPYKCDCGMRFTRLEHLKKHQSSKVCPNFVPPPQPPSSRETSSLTEFLARMANITQPQSSSVPDVLDNLTEELSNLKKPDQVLNDLKANPLITVIKSEPTPEVSKVEESSPTVEKASSPQKKTYLKSGNLYVCEFCNKMFTKGHKLNIHRRIHTGEKPYSCETCGKGFARKDHMIKHMNVHLKYRKATNLEKDDSFPDFSGSLSSIFGSYGLSAKQENENSNDENEYNGSLSGISDLSRETLFPNGFLAQNINDKLQSNLISKIEKSDLDTENLLTNESSPLLNGSAAFIKLKEMLLANYLKGNEYLSQYSVPRENASQENNVFANGSSPFSRLKEMILANSLSHSSNESTSKMKEMILANSLSHSSNESTSKMKEMILANSLSHSSNESTSKMEFPCLICGNKFSNLYNLQQHTLTHLDRTPFTCNVCRKEFKVKKNYEAHMLNHDMDEKTLSETLDLNDARSKRVQCLECNKWLVSQSSLNMHMCSHTGEKPHKCDVCDKFFVRKADMIRHRKTHSAHVPYECSYCTASYTRRNQLVLHIKKNHPGKEILITEDEIESKSQNGAIITTEQISSMKLESKEEMSDDDSKGASKSGANDVIHTESPVKSELGDCAYGPNLDNVESDDAESIIIKTEESVEEDCS